MNDPLFFTLDDVRLIRKVSINLDDFDLYAQEVQMNYVQRVLGDDLYSEFLDDLLAGVPQSQRFIDLVDGKNYQVNGRTVIFRGIKQYACYLWLYVYPLDSAAQITPIGVQIFKDEEAENAQSKQEFRQLRDHSIRQANSLEDGVKNFLNYHPTVYPEYALGSQEEPAEQDDFTFRKIGKTYREPKNKFF